MLIRDNTMQITNTMWIVGAVIIANVFLVADKIYGFFMWMCFAFILMIVEILRVNSKLKMIKRRIRFYENEIKEIEKQNKEIEEKIKSKVKGKKKK